MHIRFTSLKGRSAFDDVYRRSRRFNTGNCTVCVQYARGPVLLPRAIAVGLVVRKKFIPNAVHRNRCKRLLREVLREQMKTHEELFSEISAMIVIWNSTSAESNPSAVTQHHRLRITDVEFSIHEALLNSHSFVHQP